MAYQSWSVVFGEQPSASKWNILGTNDASFNDGTGIGDGTITPEKLLTSTGTSWPWQSWTPTLSDRFTNGDWTKDCYYTQIGKLVVFRFFVKATDATPMAGGSGTAVFSLPVTAASYPGSIQTTNPLILGPAVLVDAAPAFYHAHVRLASTTTAGIVAFNASATYLQNSLIDSTTPFTWTTNDEIHAHGFYEAA